MRLSLIPLFPNSDVTFNIEETHGTSIHLQGAGGNALPAPSSPLWHCLCSRLRCKGTQQGRHTPLTGRGCFFKTHNDLKLQVFNATFCKMEILSGNQERWDNPWDRGTEKITFWTVTGMTQSSHLILQKTVDRILHLLHQRQYWPCSGFSYKGSTYIQQPEFWFIPWLFHAWTIAIMFVPSCFFLSTHYKAIQSFPACFVSPCSIHAVRILFSLLSFSYMQSVT